jgi:hypothetical protein
MERLVKYIPWIFVAILIFMYFTKDTETKINTIKVKVPEIKEVIEKETKIVYKKLKGDTITIQGDSVKIITENPVNKDLVDNYTKQKDSISKLKLYISSIEEKEQVRTFTKGFVTVNVTSKTRGYLLEQSIEYQQKEHIIEVEKPKDNFGFLLLGGMTKANFEVGAGIRIKKLSVLAKTSTNKEIGINIIKEF